MSVETDLRERIRALSFDLAQARHGYAQLAAGAVRQHLQRQFADGLIAPLIKRVERLVRDESHGDNE